MRLPLILAATMALASTAAPAAYLLASRTSAASKQARAGEAEFRDLYRELVEINTTASEGSCTVAANAMKARLLTAGFPEKDLHVIVPLS